MNSESDKNQELESQISNQKYIQRLKTLGVVFTIFGIALFVYFIYSVGFTTILDGVAKIGFGGFAIILLLYFVKLAVRAIAWRLTVHEPYKLSLKDTMPAVIIGEALSSVIPLGILISGTAKAIAVRRKVPIVVGLSSVATENLFYSLVTGIFICIGAVTFVHQSEIDPTLVVLMDLFVGLIIIATIVVAMMVLRQWHWVSLFFSWMYDLGFFRNILKNGRGQIRLFEDLIYGFYRKYPKRFIPLCFLQVVFHSLGILEVWFIISRLSEVIPTFSTAFYLESMNRLITVVFKLVPFLVGVDEAGAELIFETLVSVVGIGVTLAIIRKGRTIFWAGIGLVLIIKRGLSFKEIQEIGEVEITNEPK